MADRILVALDETQWIHRFLAHLKLTAQPGDKIIFLIRTATSTWGDVETHLPMVETGNITSREYRGSAWRFNVEQEKQRAEELERKKRELREREKNKTFEDLLKESNLSWKDFK